MGGIVGIARAQGVPVQRGEIDSMLAAIRHRGPDGTGSRVSDGVGLGAARLAIRDVAGGAQPMSDAGGRLVLCYDGELYGLQESEGRGDTAALLARLARGRLDGLAALRGMWAFAFFDSSDGTLVLARDRHGAKPLYYVENGREFRFASEIKALLPPGCARANAASLHACLLGWGGSFGEQTLFEGVRSVPPGEALVVRDGRLVERRRFFDMVDFVDPELRRELDRGGDEGALSRFEREIERSVREQLVGEVPISCLVSGGVDSSLITSIALEASPELGLYHADVAEASERDAAERFARRVGRELVSVRVTEQDFLANLARVTFHNEVPLVYHPNSVPFFLVGRRASGDGVKVLLTGEAADSFFLGSPFVVLQPFLDRYRGAIQWIQDALHRAAPRLSSLLWPRRRADLAEQLRTLLFRQHDAEAVARAEEAFRFVEPPRERRLHIVTFANVHQHLSTLVHRNDRLGMAASIEPRHPFLDEDLARVAINLPGRFKIRPYPRFYNPRHPFLVDKWCIRQVASRRVGRELAFRPKKGFPVKLYHRLRIAPELFREGFVCEHFGLGDRALAALLDEASPLWASHLMLAEIWGRLFVAGETVDGVRARVEARVEINP